MYFGLDIQASIVGRTSSGLGNQEKAGARYPGGVGRRILPLDIQVARVRTVEGRAGYPSSAGKMNVWEGWICR